MLKAISLFCGAGGCSLGFEKTNKYQIIAAYDNNKSAVSTYNANFSNNASLVDLSQCNFSNLRDDLGLKKGDLDIIIGGPPCQGFSSAGTRNLKDPRNMLIRKYAEALQAFSPKWFFMENVEGILTTSNGEYLLDAIKLFHNLGYSVHLEKVYAHEYGIPQRRKRVVIIGSKYQSKLSFPEPQYQAIGKIFRNAPITTRHAIEDLESKTLPNISHQHKNVFGINLDRIALLQPGQTMKDLPTHLQHESFQKRANRRVQDGTPTEKRGGSPSGIKRLIYDEPSLTITGSSNREFIHPTQNRTLTIRECARLQTFPDTFLFHGNSSEQMKQIGNAIPPELARVFAEHISNLNNLSKVNNVINQQSVYFKLTKASGFSPALAMTYNKLLNLSQKMELSL